MLLINISQYLDELHIKKDKTDVSNVSKIFYLYSCSLSKYLYD